MKIGTTVILDETGALVKITKIENGKAVKGVDLSTGEVVNLLQTSFTIITLLGRIIKFIKDFVKEW